jgi:DNA-binding beta-propeller fold protein YncE
MNQPAGIDVDENGTVYVADPRNNHVQVFDRGGTFLRRFPEAAGVPREDVSAGTTVTPMDVAVAGDSVYVADVDRLLVFTNEGEFLRQFGQAGTDRVHFDGLTGVDATDDGRIYLADSGNGRVLVMEANGEKIWSVGTSLGQSELLTESHTYLYQFGLPRSVAAMDDGTVAVLDVVDSTLVLFTGEGEFVARYGMRGSSPAEFSSPGGIDAAGDVLLIADTWNHRIQVVEPAR